MRRKIVANLFIKSAGFMKLSDRLAESFSRHERGKGEMSADKFDGFITDEWKVDGYGVITVSVPDSSDTHVIFLHGGGYVTEAMAAHRRVVKEFVRKHKLKISVIDYPLSPENKYKKTLEITEKAYREITNKHLGDRFCLFGDSAGGGLALALLQILRDKSVFPFPEKTALVSPLLDLSASNCQMAEYEDKDPLLTVESIRAAAKQYIGDADTKNPMVSPIFGHMDNLGKVFISAGTNEILYPDCVLLRDKLRASYGSEVTFFCGDMLVHDWILAVPLMSAANDLLDKIADFYN